MSLGFPVAAGKGLMGKTGTGTAAAGAAPTWAAGSPRPRRFAVGSTSLSSARSEPRRCCL
uniref:ATP-dependent Clp protease ATP-binding subunit clpX n=1 Tax=Arundo donax TaxID=35708 RepID=A0A0A9EXZ0_ARUDO